jgi:hypothetical protein
MIYNVSFQSEVEKNNYLRAVEAVRVPSAGEMYVTRSYEKNGVVTDGLLRQVEAMPGFHYSFVHQLCMMDVQQAA